MHKHENAHQLLSRTLEFGQVRSLPHSFYQAM